MTEAMSTELKDRLLRIEAMCQGNSGVCKDIAFEARMALQAMDSQPFTVIAPPLEWGEQKGLLIHSKCGRYDLRLGARDYAWRAWSNDDKAFSPLNHSPSSEIAAKAACQAHAQAQVNAALEGCNVIPYRDPQRLVDALRQISEVLKRFCQTGKLGELQQSVIDAELILKQWEDGK